MEAIADFIADFEEDIKHNRLILPSLPEVALKVRDIIENPKVNAHDISKVVSADPALSARLIRVANSPLYRAVREIENVQDAVTRMGMATVRHLVNSLVMEQLYQPKVSSAYADYLRVSWEHSTLVAAICRILAKNYTRLNPDQALFAGLIHDIGVLPIISKVELYADRFDEDVDLDDLIHQHHGHVGEVLLKHWNFPKDMIAVVAEHENLKRDSKEGVDYVDLVLIANLHCYIGSEHRLGQVALDTVPAFKKLKLKPKQAVDAIREASKEIKALQRLFLGK